jgi:hypothetical protein
LNREKKRRESEGEAIIIVRETDRKIPVLEFPNLCFLLRVSVCWGEGKALGGEEVSVVGNIPYMALQQRN